MPPVNESKNPYSRQDTDSPRSAETLLQSLEFDKNIPRTAGGVLTFREEYKAKGFDLEQFYKAQPETKKRDQIQDNFFKSKENSIAAQLGEQLPLLANKQGRLGPYIEARVTKTLRPDDQGNSFVDLVVEIKNKWIETLGDDIDVPSKMTFLVDTTTDVGSRLEDKEVDLQNGFLNKAERANVKCYKSQYGELGITRPKLVVGKERDYYETVGKRLGNLVNKTASDAFSISQPELFDERYREYFKDFASSLADNASKNAVFLRRKFPRSIEHEKLANEYQKIADFLRLYDKTPTKLMSS